MELLTIIKIVTAIISLILVFFGVTAIFSIFSPQYMVMGIYQGYRLSNDNFRV